METTLTLLTKQNIMNYLESKINCEHEQNTLIEILAALNDNNKLKLEWFSLFGDDIRRIILNSYAYKKGIEFGFSTVDFDQYGWLTRPTFLDIEELRFGFIEQGHYGSYSSLTLGRGLNNVWTYGYSVSFGTAGTSSGISVYDPNFSSRAQALDHGITKLKNMLLPKIGDSDTTNYNQKIILETLRSIKKYEINKVQLSLF